MLQLLSLQIIREYDRVIMDLTEKNMKNGMDMHHKNGVKHGLTRVRTSNFTQKVKKRKKKTTATIKVAEKLMTRATTTRIQIAVIIR